MSAGTWLGTATFPGLPELVQGGRYFVRGVLGPEHPATPDAELVTSEGMANAICHTDSGRTGGSVRIGLFSVGQAVRLEITDDGGAVTKPEIQAEPDEHGYGLRLVEALAKDWGVRIGETGTTVWAEFSCRGGRSDAARPLRGT